jgi:predicted aspartyl protease
VGGEVHRWEEGRVVAFDDTYEHEAWNRSKQVRVLSQSYRSGVIEVCRGRALTGKNQWLRGAAILAGACLLPCVVRASSLMAQAPQTGPPTGTAAEKRDALYAAPTRRDRIGRIVAPVTINGHGPFGFIVDTGATHAAISTRTALSLGLAPRAEHSMMLNGTTGSEPVETVEVDRVEAGDLKLEHQRMPVLGSVIANADGILGVENLEDKRLLVDFVHDRVEIARSRGERAPAGFIAVPTKIRAGLLVIDASIGRLSVKAVIDTGAESTLGNEVLAHTLGIRPNPKRPPSEVSGATSPVQPGHSVVIPRIGLGRAQVTNVDVTFGDIYVFKLWNLEKQPALVIGMDVLGKLDAMVIDYRRRELQIRFPRIP